MKYSDFHYERIRIQNKEQLMAGWLNSFSRAKSAKRQISVLEKVDQMGKEYRSYAAIASLNFSRDI